jgi:hypothetical protein
MTLVWLRRIIMNQVDTPANKDNNNNNNNNSISTVSSLSRSSSSSLTTSKLAFLNNLLGVYNYESDIARNAIR